MSKKPVGKPIKITLTESQISDIIQRAAKTRRSIRVESLEDRIAPSRIGLPIFGGVEDADKFDDAPPAAPGALPGEEFPDGEAPGEIFPGDSDESAFGDTGTGGSSDPFAPPTPGGDPNDGLIDPTNPGDGILDPTNPDLTETPPVDPDGGVLDPELGGDEIVNPQVEVDESANVEFNENLHQQGGAPDSGLSAEEMEEHRLNILRQLRGQ